MNFRTKSAYWDGKGEQHQQILLILISVGTKFQLNWQLSFFGRSLLKKSIIPVEKRKSKHHHWVLLIRSSQGTNFHSKNFFFELRDEICPKRVFSFKKKKVNITYEFCIFDLVYNNFHNILRLLDSWSNFNFTTSEIKHDL